MATLLSNKDSVVGCKTALPRQRLSPSVLGSGQVSVEEKLRDKIELLREENQQLRDLVDSLIGGDLNGAAQYVFGMTAAEAKAFLVIVQCGRATNRLLADAVYADGRLARLEDPELAVRGHIKRMRKKLNKFGIEIQTLYGFGYALSEEMQAKARALIEGRGK